MAITCKSTQGKTQSAITGQGVVSQLLGGCQYVTLLSRVTGTYSSSQFKDAEGRRSPLSLAKAQSASYSGDCQYVTLLSWRPERILVLEHMKLPKPRTIYLTSKSSDNALNASYCSSMLLYKKRPVFAWRIVKNSITTKSNYF